MLKQNY